MSIYDFSVTKKDGTTQALSDYKGKNLLIVNTASKCGFTPQYNDLQQLYENYNKDGFEVLAFPCNQFANQEPSSNEEIEHFCKVNYGVTFPIMAKIDVKGDNADPLFKYLSQQAPGLLGSTAVKWNFTKFLIDRDGKVVKRFGPQVKPLKIENDIKSLI